MKEMYSAQWDVEAFYHLGKMKKKITKTLLIEPEDEKIEMVNNVIPQSIEELLVPYEKRRTYLPRKPPK